MIKGIHVCLGGDDTFNCFVFDSLKYAINIRLFTISSSKIFTTVQVNRKSVNEKLHEAHNLLALLSLLFFCDFSFVRLLIGEIVKN